MTEPVMIPPPAGSGPGLPRRSVLIGGTLLGLSAAASAQAAANNAAAAVDPDAPGSSHLRPEQGPTAGPIRPGRGSDLKGKTAIVTGAARGIGRAIAVELAANGADVAVLDICGPVSPASDALPAQPDELDETMRMIEGYGRRSMAVRADIRHMAELRQIADRLETDWGHIDVVVANAAIQRWKPLLEMEDSDWCDVIDNNLNGTANTIRAFAPKMVARRSGRIIVVSSMQGKHGTKDASSYSASKWGILGLMKSAAMELGSHGVTVNAVIPGLVDTALTRYEKRYREAIGETQADPPQTPSPEQAWTARKTQVPLKVGWLEPEDIAPAAVFLASDAAAMVTGAEFEVTAGDSAHSV